MPNLVCADRADDLLGRNAVGLLSPRPHELDAAARHDERLEAISAQVREQFLHRHVDEIRVGPIEAADAEPSRASRGSSCRSRDGHAGVGDGREAAGSASDPIAASAVVIACHQRLECRIVLPLGMFRRRCLHLVEHEQRPGSRAAARPTACRRCRTPRCGLRVRRKSDAPGVVTSVDELDDRLLRGALVPRGEWLREREAAQRQQRREDGEPPRFRRRAHHAGNRNVTTNLAPQPCGAVAGPSAQ